MRMGSCCRCCLKDEREIVRIGEKKEWWKKKREQGWMNFGKEMLRIIESGGVGGEEEKQTR